MKRWDLKLSVFYCITDLFTLNLVLFFLVTSLLGTQDNLVYLSKLSAFSIIWSVLAFASNLYTFHRHSNFKFRLLNYLKCHFAFSVIISLLAFSFGSNENLAPFVIKLIITFPLVNLTCVSFLMYSIGFLRTLGRNAKKVLIVGSSSSSTHVLNYLESNPDFGYKIIGVITDKVIFSDQQEVEMAEDVVNFDEVILKYKPNEIIITSPTNHYDRIQFVMNRADFYGVRVKLIPDYSQLIGTSFSLSTFGELPVINVRAINLDKLYLSIIKRVFDIVFSIAALLFLAPLMLCIMLAIRLNSAGPLFYCPVRVGKGGKEFKVFKFRSMYTNIGLHNPNLSTSRNDPRLTPVGAFIRKYSLDELPQFLNVLMGDMSVVGPRPHRVNLNQVMQQEVEKYMLRHYLKPGITGWAQVNGWRGPTETEEERMERTRHDLWYVQNWSLTLDLKIVCRTVFDPRTHKKAF